MAHLERINVQVRYFTLKYGGLSGLRVRQSFFLDVVMQSTLPYDAKQVDVISGPVKKGFRAFSPKVQKKHLNHMVVLTLCDTTLYSVGRH